MQVCPWLLLVNAGFANQLHFSPTNIYVISAQRVQGNIMCKETKWKKSMFWMDK